MRLFLFEQENIHQGLESRKRLNWNIKKNSLQVQYEKNLNTVCFLRRSFEVFKNLLFFLINFSFHFSVFFILKECNSISSTKMYNNFVNRNYHKLKVIILPTVPKAFVSIMYYIGKKPLANSQSLSLCQHTIILLAA